MKTPNKDYATRTITCVHCGNVVTKPMPAGRKFCSHICYRSAPKPERKSGKTIPCTLCGVMVYIPRHRLAETKDFFCSPAHANEWQGRHKIGYTCKTCGKTFRRPASFEKFGRMLYCSSACRYANPDTLAQLLEMNAAQQRRHESSIERIGYALLDSLQIDYARQYVIGGKFCVDAFVPSHKLVIQFDGDYWHGHPHRFLTPNAQQRRRMRLDLSQDAYMRACGYQVVRLWESDLRHNLDAIVLQLQTALQDAALP